MRKSGSAKPRSSRFSKLKAGKKGASICGERGISEATLYNWRAKYGGLEVSDLMKLRQLEDENRLLKSSPIRN
jgi:putative transposase